MSRVLNRNHYFLKFDNGVSQTHLLKPVFNNCPVQIPPLPEQRAIAAALSDVDALIESLEKLIAKKRDVKQATMQQLLTGATRLPGFEGEWEVKRLGEVAEITTGRKDVNQGNPTGQYPFFTCSREHTFSDDYTFDTVAIMIAGNGDVGNLHFFEGKFEAYQRTYVLHSFSIDERYLWYQLSLHLSSSLGLGKVGTSIPYIKMEDLTHFEFITPSKLADQKAIASVLSDLDAEIEALEARRDKTKLLKQGMMQELLTGKTRLV
jgi:type I restriction enzyme S subunit